MRSSKWGVILGVGLLLAGSAHALWRAHAEKEECCATRPAKAAPTVVAAAAPTTETRQSTEPSLAAWESVDKSFEGCARSCGAGRGARRDDAHVQPGAAAGDFTYCPVSGALFQVSSGTPKRTVDGTPYYFCCDTCATYFSSHTAEVLAKRGIASGAASSM